MYHINDYNNESIITITIMIKKKHLNKEQRMATFV